MSSQTVLTLATRNAHKIREIEEILRDSPIRVEPAPEGIAFVEEGETFEENACSKALACSRAVAGWVAADDSGLVVPALGGEPGVRSARYARPHDDAANNRKLLDELARRAPDRRDAHFVCAIALARAGRILWTVRGECYGRIARAPRGAGGFGYDPLFEVPALGKTFAEISAEEKNRWSHRAMALRAFRDRFPEALARPPGCIPHPDA